MADGVSGVGGVGASRRTRRAAALVVIGVLIAALHAVVVSEVAASIADFGSADTAMPARLQVAYVRSLEPEAPDPVASPAPALQAPRPRVAPVPARAASQSETLAAREPAERRPPDATAAADAAVPIAAGDAAASSAGPAASSSSSDPGVVAAIGASAADPGASEVASVAVKQAANPASGAIALGAGASPAASQAASRGGFEWPRSTRVSYDLTGSYRGDLSGQAEVEWIRIGERYQVNVDISAGPSFAPIFRRRMTSAGTLGDSGLTPARYDEDTRFLTRDRRASIVFSADSVELANGQKQERLAGVQDTASQFIQFTWLFGSRPDVLRVGTAFDFPLALPRGMRRWTYDVVEADTLYTSFGPLPVFHLKPRIAERKPNELLVEMWFSPDLRYLPVRIRIEQESGSYLDLLIAKKPEMSAS